MLLLFNLRRAAASIMPRFPRNRSWSRPPLWNFHSGRGQFVGFSAGGQLFLRCPPDKLRCPLWFSRVSKSLTLWGLVFFQFLCVSVALPGTGLLGSASAGGPLIDPLDGQPLGWKLVASDCRAEVVSHWLDPTAGLDRRPCEAMQLNNNHGTEAILQYSLEPAQIIEELRASLYVQSVRSGLRIGLRIRYPRVIDPATRAPVQAYVWGQTHRGGNRWEMLTVAPTANVLHLKEMAIRGVYGSSVDLNNAYVDAIVVNAYTGTGMSAVRLDNLRIDGLVAWEDHVAANSKQPAANQRTGIEAIAASQASLGTLRDSGRGREPASGLTGESSRYDGSAILSAFPRGRTTRILEYNGESLEYLKILGFDAILLARPPTLEILRSAAQHSLAIYAPAPSAPDPNLEPYLAPVAGWYLGTSSDESQLSLAAEEEKRIRGFPTLWRRPAIVAPAEAWDRYAGIATSFVYDVPLPARGLSGDEESRLLLEQSRRTGRPVATAVGITTHPSQKLIAQLNGISRSLGASEIEDYGWHAIYLQVARAMVLAPQAYVFRSSHSLTSGRQADNQRAAALGIINRWIQCVSPALQEAQFRGFLISADPRYHVTHLSSGGVELLVAVRKSESNVISPGVALPSGPLRFRLPSNPVNFAWRITDASAQQLTMPTLASSQQLQIESPDLVEWVILGNDPNLGGRLDRVLRQHALMLNQERWQLASDAAMRSREDWRAAMGGGLLPRTAYPEDLLRSAASLLSGVQGLIAQQRWSAAMSATRSADELIARSDNLLRSRLQPGNVLPAGMPTLLVPGGTILQLAWLPSLEDGRWTDNLLAAGQLDDSVALQQTGWVYQRRLEKIANSAMGIDVRAGETGSGALRLEAVSKGQQPLPGGYAGTVGRVVSSPMTIPVGTWVRVEARLKTLGFGGPHQGLLVYDSDAGSENGMLVRGDANWQTVRMYRVVTSERPFRVTMESLGDGEALIDWISVSAWQPPTGTEPFFYPISTR